MGTMEVKNRWVSPQRRAWWRVRGCRRTITAASLAPMPTLENRLVLLWKVMEAQARRTGVHSHTPGAVSRSSSTWAALFSFPASIWSAMVYPSPDVSNLDTSLYRSCIFKLWVR